MATKEKDKEPTLLERIRETDEMWRSMRFQLDKATADLEEFYRMKKAELKALKEIIG